MIKMNRSRNIEQFDCRRYIAPGDHVRVNSMKACFTMDEVQRHGTIQTDAYVLRAYESFILVKLNRIVECINRWDIISVNDKPVGNDIGWFGGFRVREEKA